MKYLYEKALILNIVIGIIIICILNFFGITLSYFYLGLGVLGQFFWAWLLEKYEGWKKKNKP